MVIQWTAKLNKGLFSPTCDDTELEEITELDFILQRMNNRKCSISIFNDINSKLQNLLSDFNYCKICL